MKKSTEHKIIILLAYFHGYVYPITLIFGGIIFCREYAAFVFGVWSIVYGLYTLIGYLLRWKHVYCSLQDGHHKTMTPHLIY